MALCNMANYYRFCISITLGTMEMRSKFKIIFSLGLITALAFFISSCSHTHEPLHEIYYGNFDVGSKDNFVIMAFSYKEENKVAFRTHVDGSEMNVIFPVFYTKNSVVIKTDAHKWKFTISKDNHVLSCLSCDGKSMPKKYTVGMYKGKPMLEKTAKTAFDTIEKSSKFNGATAPT